MAEPYVFNNLDKVRPFAPAIRGKIFLRTVAICDSSPAKNDQRGWKTVANTTQVTAREFQKVKIRIRIPGGDLEAISLFHPKFRWFWLGGFGHRIR